MAKRIFEHHLLLLVVACCICCFMLAACYEGDTYASDFENVDDKFGKNVPSEADIEISGRSFPIEVESALAALKLKNLEVVTVDDSLNGVDSVVARFNADKDRFYTDSLFFKNSSIAKLKFTCVFEDSKDSKTMDFVEYVRVQERSTVYVRLFDALLSKRIEYLVQKKGYSYSDAYDKAYLEASWLLEWRTDNKYNVSNAALPKEMLTPLVYLYGRFFLKEPSFYKTFTELADSVGGSSSWWDFLPAVTIGDDVARYYKMNQRNFDDDQYESLKKTVLFTNDYYAAAFRIVETAYNMPRCDSLGLVAINDKKSSAFKGESFVCDMFDSNYAWRAMNAYETKLGPCVVGMDDSLKVGDSTFVCQKNNREWKAVLQKGAKGIPENSFDGRAVKLFGNCGIANEQKLAHEDTIFARCEKGTWRPVDDVIFYEGECNVNRENVRVKIPEAKYFICNSGAWKPIITPLYYRESCDREGKLVSHDSSYYICDRVWKLLKDDEVLPPVKKLDECPYNTYVEKYGNRYYACMNGYWHEATEKDDYALPALKDGLLCRDSIRGMVVEYDSVVLKCGDGWGYASYYEVDSLRVNKSHKDECKGSRVGTSALPTKYHTMACDSKDHLWHYVGLNNSPYAANVFKDSIIASGKFISDSVYRIKLGDFSYDFVKIELQNKGDEFFGLTKASDGTRDYGAFAYGGNLFLSGGRGIKTVAFDKLTERSDSFDSFWHAYRDTTLYQKSTVLFEFWDDGIYMDYEAAQKFCPKGFHIPDTTEWHGMSYPSVMNGYYKSDAPFKMTHNGFGTYVDLFWTTLKKDDETQYCIELTYNEENGKSTHTLNECPKDLYPLVQTLCVKDK